MTKKGYAEVDKELYDITSKPKYIQPDSFNFPRYYVLEDSKKKVKKDNTQQDVINLTYEVVSGNAKRLQCLGKVYLPCQDEVFVFKSEDKLFYFPKGNLEKLLGGELNER